MGKKSVFILENDADILAVLDIVLSKDYKISLFSKPPDDFIERVKNEKPDVLLLDWLISNINTIELVKPIKLVSPSTKVIIISAHQDVDRAFKKMPVDAILHKPFGMHSIKNLLSEVLNRQA